MFVIRIKDSWLLIFCLLRASPLANHIRGLSSTNYRIKTNHQGIHGLEKNPKIWVRLRLSYTVRIWVKSACMCLCDNFGSCWFYIYNIVYIKWYIVCVCVCVDCGERQWAAVAEGARGCADGPIGGRRDSPIGPRGRGGSELPHHCGPTSSLSRTPKTGDSAARSWSSTGCEEPLRLFAKRRTFLRRGSYVQTILCKLGTTS